jgi:hypothetical protein
MTSQYDDDTFEEKPDNTRLLVDVLKHCNLEVPTFFQAGEYLKRTKGPTTAYKWGANGLGGSRESFQEVLRWIVSRMAHVPPMFLAPLHIVRGWVDKEKTMVGVLLVWHPPKTRKPAFFLEPTFMMQLQHYKDNYKRTFPSYDDLRKVVHCQTHEALPNCVRQVCRDCLN